MNIKEASKQKELFTGGHRACAGCGAVIVARQVLAVAGPNTVVTNATGCLEVVSTIFPYTAWNVPFIHSAFENAAATISGVEALYKSWVRQKKYDKKVNFIAFGGDGGTYYIGLQSLSGALERGHNFVYVCYTNEAYMNTGIQRSSATPFGASTTTAPEGKKSIGKTQFRKDLTAIVAAHNIPYAAQASVSNWNDLVTKAQKAFQAQGPAFLNVLALCHRGWRYPDENAVSIAKLAVETCYWPLYEVIDGKGWKINYKPKEKRPIIEWIKSQGRFKHLFKPENESILKNIQEHIDLEWNYLLKRAGEPSA